MVKKLDEHKADALFRALAKNANQQCFSKGTLVSWEAVIVIAIK